MDDGCELWQVRRLVYRLGSLWAGDCTVLYCTVLYCTVQVRRLVYRAGSLWAGDELGSVCRWARDLSSCQLKQEGSTQY